MYTEINAALQSLKVINDWVRSNKSLANYNELVAAVSEVSAKLMRANEIAITSQEKQMLLTQRISDLEKEIAELKNRECGKQKYSLHEFPTGVRAFTPEPNMQVTEPIYYLCENCMGKNQISRMQPDGFRDGKAFFLRCHSCNLLIPIIQMSNALERSIRARIKP